MQEALNSFQIAVVNYDIDALGLAILSQIRDVGRLHIISIGDLQVKAREAGVAPADVRDAVKYGTKFFDALLYFAVEHARRPQTTRGEDIGEELPAVIMKTKKHLLWMAIYLMLRGSYPSDAGNNVGTNVPAFLRNICGMNISPHELAASLASFELKNINPNWIRKINWTTFAPEIRQRLGLGLSGYRMLQPFSCYDVRAGASQEAIDAAEFVKRILALRPDYAILSCTRSPTIVNRFKSWNKALGNLILECFNDHQIDEMVANKIIFARPVRDPRADTWKSWVAGGDLVLVDPIEL